MNADEVFSELKAHEKKCDERQTTMYAKIDKLVSDVDDKNVHLVKVVYMGIGIMAVVNTFALVVGPIVLKSLS